MKIALLGATGVTGKALLQQALDQDHEVVAIVRTATKLADIVHEKLTVVEADVFSEDDLKKYLHDVDAVMSTLGFAPAKNLTSYSCVTKTLVKVLREVSSCRRVVLLHSWYTSKKSRDAGSFFLRWVLFPIIGSLLDDMRTTEEFLQSECEDIQYTVVRPPGLNNDPKTDLAFEVVNDADVIVGASSKISRADVARYMLNVLQDESAHRKFQAITVKTT